MGNPNKINYNPEIIPTTEVEPAPGFPEILKEISSTNITVYEVLSPTNQDAARQEFTNNPDLITPHYEYGKLEPDRIATNLGAIAEIYTQLDTTPLTGPERPTLQVLTDDVAKKNAFVQSCIEYNAAATAEEKEKAAKAHRFAGEALYGTPDEATFYALLSGELAKINQEALTPEDCRLYDSLISDIGEIKPIATEQFKPKPETVKRFSEMINLLFENFWPHIPEGKDEFTTKEACDITNEIIRDEIGEGATEYRAVMSDTAKNVSTKHDDRTIIFPVNRSAGNFSRLGLKKILVHELGTHAYRALNYEDSDIDALSHELPGNEEIDEGIAKCCEQAIAGKYSDSGVEHYINIGLANFKGKNFREIFEIQQKLLYLQGCKPGESEEDKATRLHAKDSAIFNRTTRCLRGTGELPNNKDLVYYNGANRVWRFIEEHIDDPDLLDQLFLSGKSDIFDEDQQRLIYETKVS